MSRAFVRTLLPSAAALALAACGGEEAEPTYEAGAEDVGGGELIVSTPDPDAVPVTLPETPMTPVPADSADPAATASPSPTPDGPQTVN